MNQKPILGQGIGRRKSAVAKVQIISGTGEFIINNQPGVSYLQQNPSSVLSIQSPFDLLDLQNKYDTIIQVKGGGMTGQASAIQLGLTRALCKMQDSYRTVLKPKGMLTRDARIKERKKYGLKKARKAPQFSKR
uniref:ribosomal protein S9 n=1 Tax=Tetraselmis marina TaxID=41888 RepID=UPI0021AC41A0|nr:ribosomal protein S9 [Tetraselmis marina]UUA64527.1 ribosomal protein S9 [Tetraselmis marina]